MQCAVRRRTVCTEFENGDKLFSEGEPGFERGVRFEFFNGDKQIYDGPMGLERLIRVEWADGVVTHFEGSRGNELEQTHETRKGKFSKASSLSSGSSASKTSSRSPKASWNRLSHSQSSSHGVVLHGSRSLALGSSKSAASVDMGAGARTATASALSTPVAAPQQGAISNRTSVTMSHEITPGLLSQALAQARASNNNTKRDNTKLVHARSG